MYSQFKSLGYTTRLFYHHTRVKGLKKENFVTCMRLYRMKTQKTMKNVKSVLSLLKPLLLCDIILVETSYLHSQLKSLKKMKKESECNEKTF